MDMLADRQYAPTATTIIILTLARLTATTDLTGSQVECSLAPVRGMAGAAVGAVGVEVGDAIGTAMGAGFAAVVSPAAGALTVDAGLHTGQADSAPVMGSMVEVASAASTVGVTACTEVAAVASTEAGAGSTEVAAEEDSTAAVVEEDSTVAAVDMLAVADTGNRKKLIPDFLIRQISRETERPAAGAVGRFILD
jgi:hypothetical protein